MTREGAIKHIELFKRCERLGGAIEDALDMAIAALREQPRWIPVEERLPEEDGFYLVWGPTIYTGTRWYDKSNFSRYFWRHDVTHWMPLPEAPKEV